MKYFVFRNQTVEPFFGEHGVAYSGYGDIGRVPHEAERYVWFYQVPPNPNRSQLAAEVATYADKLHMVLEQIGPKELWVLTLVDLFPVRLTASDTQVEDAVQAFNAEAWRLARERRNLRVADLSEFTGQYAAAQLVNWKFYFVSQTLLNPKLARDFARWFARKEDELALKRKKCLVLDLDNTLWGGILGEDGIAGLQVGGDYPGKAFLCWQQALLELQRAGVILAVCSKNNEHDVLEAWQRNPFMVLRREHFSAWRINWQDKATNLQELAEELNIGLDAMVFVDDNPTERALVRQTLPAVCVPEFPEKPYELMAFFRQLVCDHFRVYAVTDEDRSKTDQYRANALRAAQRSQFVDMDAYLRSLDMEVTLSEADDFNISRIAQMTQKTNQFNLTTRRLTEQDIRRLVDGGWRVFCISVADRFGASGITGALFVTPARHIDNLLLSCRILGKGIEEAFLRTVLNRLRREGAAQVTASYVPSPKNGQTADFYDRMGFTLQADDARGRLYVKTLADDEPVKDYYRIITQ